MRYYKEAVHCFGHNLPAQYSLGQMYIREQNWGNALRCYEEIVGEVKDKCEECYKVLGYLYNKTGKRAEAVKYYQLAKRFDPYDYETFIEYGMLQEQHDLEEALQAFETAVDILKEKKKENEDKDVVIQPELLSNIGVILMKLKQFEEARKKFTQASKMVNQELEKNPKDIRMKGISVAIQFNLGILSSEAYQFGEATMLFKQIINKNPLYIDAYIRRAWLEWLRGAKLKSLDIIDQALDKKDQLIIKSSKLASTMRLELANCFKAFILCEMGDEDKAREVLVKNRRKGQLELSAWAKLFLAKLDYSKAVQCRDNYENQKKCLKNVLEIARDVLTKEENNIQAALAISIVLAESHQFVESKEILTQLQGYSQTNKRVHLNLANLQFLMRNYDNAQQLYKLYLSKIKTIDEQVEMQMVVTLYLADQWEEAFRRMKLLILKFPDNLIYRYNFNVLIHNYAKYLIDQPLRQKEHTERAIILLNSILPLYQHMYRSNEALSSRLSFESSEKKQLKVTMLEKMRDSSENKFNYIKSNQESFKYMLRKDEESKREELKRQKEREKLQQQIMEKEKKEKERQKSLELEEKQRQEEIAKKSMQLAYEMQQTSAQLYREKQEQKEKRKKNKGGIKKKKDDKDEEDEFREVFESPVEDPDQKEGDSSEEKHLEEELPEMFQQKKNKMKRKVKKIYEQDKLQESEQKPGKRRRKLRKLNKKKSEEEDSEEEIDQNIGANVVVEKNENEAEQEYQDIFQGENEGGQSEGEKEEKLEEDSIKEEKEEYNVEGQENEWEEKKEKEESEEEEYFDFGEKEEQKLAKEDAADEDKNSFDNDFLDNKEEEQNE